MDIIIYSSLQSKTCHMLLPKKSKHDEKGKMRTSQTSHKRLKKPKNTSPSKLKVTPEKRRIKKDENCHTNRPYLASMHLDLNKSKDREQRHSHISKKNHSHKNKHLTTSPIDFDDETGTKRKSKSKSRSMSKVNTHRSQHTDREKDLLKSVSRKLYAHIKEHPRNGSKSKSHSKDKSKSHSKSKSHIKTDRDISPLRKTAKSFNVADREIRYSRTESVELKKTMRKKINNKRIKEDPMMMYPTQPLRGELAEEPKVKLKKKVPQIKTEFSERRKSFFDENLLKTLAMQHQDPRAMEGSPFHHINSQFEVNRGQMRIEDDNAGSSLSRQQESAESTSRLKIDEIRDQENKWMMILKELNNFKSQGEISENLIDSLITKVSQNHHELQEKVSKLSKDERVVESEDTFIVKADVDSRYPFTVEQIESQETIPLTRKKQPQDERVEQQPQESKQRGRGLEVIAPSQQDKIQQESPSLPKSLVIQTHEQDKLQLIKPIMVPVTTEGECSPISNQPESQFKRSTNIEMKQFFGEDFARSEKINSLRMEIMREKEHSTSDRNLLKELEIEEVSKEISEERRAQLEYELEEHLREAAEGKAAEQGEQGMEQGRPEFAGEVRGLDEPGEDSFLVRAERSDRQEKLVWEVLSGVVMEFCGVMLRSKSMLHHFLTAYSSVVGSSIVIIDEGNPPQVPCSNEYVLEVAGRLTAHVMDKYGQEVLHQLALPFQHAPLELLRFMRMDEEEAEMTGAVAAGMADNEVEYPMTVIDAEKVEEFEVAVLKNECYIPGYFSFNHCVYDAFNDIVDQMRPFGQEGKPIFAIDLTHPRTDPDQIQQEIMQRMTKITSTHYCQEPIPDFKNTQEHSFEVRYFCSLEVLDIILGQEVQALARLQAKRRLMIFQ